MLKVALTGGIASGKTTVARLFRQAGVPVVDADEVARQVVSPGGTAHQALRQAFGPEFFHPDGTLDRPQLSRYVFSRPEALECLNRLLHPCIAQAVRERLEELASRGEPLVIVEVPLLFELGLEGQYDGVIVVWVDPATQSRRLAARDRREDVEIDGILAAQMPLAAKRARAQFVIDNSGAPDLTAAQVENLLRELQNILDKKT